LYQVLTNKLLKVLIVQVSQTQNLTSIAPLGLLLYNEIAIALPTIYSPHDSFIYLAKGYTCSNSNFEFFLDRSFKS
jgi:hypothetical protein